MHTDIREYIKLDRSTRREHLDLNDVCIEIGGSSRDFRSHLAHSLMTTIPVGCRVIYLCHACNNDKCSNIKHLYWGTPKDNHIDLVESGRYKSLSQRTKEKYGDAEYSKMMKQFGSMSNKRFKTE